MDRRHGDSSTTNPSCDSGRCANLLCAPIGILDGQRPPKGDRTKALIGWGTAVGKAERYRKNTRHAEALIGWGTAVGQERTDRRKLLGGDRPADRPADRPRTEERKRVGHGGWKSGTVPTKRKARQGTDRAGGCGRAKGNGTADQKPATLPASGGGGGAPTPLAALPIQRYSPTPLGGRDPPKGTGCVSADPPTGSN